VLHGGGVPNLPGQLFDGQAQRGVAELRGQVAERLQNEGPLGHARMGNDEFRLIHDARSKEQKIDVEGAGSVALATLAPGAGLDFELPLQQRARCEGSSQAQHCIQVGALGRRPNRSRLVDAGGTEQSDASGGRESRDRFLEVDLAVSQVRPQGNEDVVVVLHGEMLQLHSSPVTDLSPRSTGHTQARFAPPTLPPALETEVPGPKSRSLATRLGKVECRNVTCVEPTPPIFWERAAGANVWDVDGNRYVDLTAGFGVTNVGHNHPRVVQAAADQSARMLHAMGDVHPAAVKVELLEALVRRYPGGAAARATLGSSGSDAVEIAIKTALLATGRAGVLAFEGAYHGLSFGALDATWRPLFRTPFAARLPNATVFAPFGELEAAERTANEAKVPIGAVLVEPIQGRGGERIPPDGFLAGLRALCDRKGWLLIADEVYTGFGRTGRWFACEHEDVIPDLLCVGKGLTSGFPLSACLGREEVMNAWPPAGDEAIHTQTFLGHPPACAAGVASLAALEEEKLVERAAETGELALARLRERLAGAAGIVDIRGRGLLLGIECETSERATNACKRALDRGVIVLASGDDARVVSFTPPLCIDAVVLELAIDIMVECLE